MTVVRTSQERCPTCGAELQRFTSRLHCPACNKDVTLTSNGNLAIECLQFAAILDTLPDMDLYARLSTHSIAIILRKAGQALQSSPSETSEPRLIQCPCGCGHMIPWGALLKVTEQHEIGHGG